MWEEQGERGRKGEAEKGDWQRDLGEAFPRLRHASAQPGHPLSLLTSLTTFSAPAGVEKNCLQLSLILGGTLARPSTRFWMASFSDSLRRGTCCSAGVWCRGPVGFPERAGCCATERSGRSGADCPVPPGRFLGCSRDCKSFEGSEFMVGPGPGYVRLVLCLRPCPAEAAACFLVTSVEPQRLPIPRAHPALAAQGQTSHPRCYPGRKATA